MGYLTSVTLHNDALHAFQQDPELFAKAVFEAIDKANGSRKEEDAGFKGYCNYISAHPSRHADDVTIYVHYGNCVFNLNPYCQDFKRLLDRPEILEPYVAQAEWFAKEARKKLNEAKKKLKTNED